MRHSRADPKSALFFLRGSRIRYKRRHLGIRCLPRAHQPVAVLADKFVEMPAARLERGMDARRQFYEHAVGLNGRDKPEAEFAQPGSEGFRLAIRMLAIAQPRTIPQHRHPLR